ncbi:Actin- protein 2/3 complex subunit 3 [Stylosanthes scabra]|uniref:Actin- protein 2/3 complex subunit 3 n=1 Tax=Stylosanthes scabra TaxID=79078 RepID=A0ABU6QN12_9FABA|nr:Actin- protein 2/3 complex subunit 3 [Stylosanthes scabra]
MKFVVVVRFITLVLPCSYRTDIVDEAITFFRANVFFRNFDIKRSADKLLIYLTSYINVALKRLEGCRTLAEGTKDIIILGFEKVPIPGESGFPFPSLLPLPQSHEQAGLLVLQRKKLLTDYQRQLLEEKKKVDVLSINSVIVICKVVTVRRDIRRIVTAFVY